ncbi:release factor glutamine methyltransferase [Vespertiliibacter pulmonis]|uniref:Release factor glutamine methyltransferase n=1 Tax=Vespertiliibacter pulmonis TaxID=1443036 RepID=A0A3N4VL19_9PAST|nr:release factor glutamine methyltransferase [Vespertiliibacter pulmonis]
MNQYEKSQWAFGMTPNTLVNLVVAGEKTATCSGKLFYTLENEPLPTVTGKTEIILDAQGNPVVEIQITDVFVEKFGKVPEEFALAEGEGDFAYWRAIHQQFFNQQIQSSLPLTEQSQFGIENQQVTDDFEVVCERFHAIKIYPKTYQQWLEFAQQALLENAEKDPYLNPKTDANLLLQAVTKRSKSAIFAFNDTILTENELRQLAQKLARRAKGEPMAYILGEKEFWSLPIMVSPVTLIPRPDTERLVEIALEIAYKRLDSQSFLHILDLGTGTGAIALALASELGNKAEILGIDKQPEAVALAKKNQQALGLNNVYFKQGNWFDTLQNEQFDLIVSNPPYIDAQDCHLNKGDVRFEPLSALIADEKGTADLQKIIKNAPLYLKNNGALILEHGWQQAHWVQHTFKQHQWHNIQTAQDYGGNERVTWAIWTR